jgi:DNA replication factor GINS
MAMVFAIIMIDVSKYDKLLEDLKAMLFSERKSRKLNRIEPNFYKNIHSLFVQLTTEKDLVVSSDITEYMEITKLLAEVRKNFKAFFQVRFEKIGKYSVYDEIEEYLYNMSAEEKNIMKDLNSQMKGYYADFTAVTRQNEEVEEMPEDIENLKPPVEEPIHKPENEEPGTEVPDVAEEMVLVRILKDQPPIAQPDKDYYLHKNDILYISGSFAKMLNAHGFCSYIEKGKKL